MTAPLAPTGSAPRPRSNYNNWISAIGGVIALGALFSFALLVWMASPGSAQPHVHPPAEKIGTVHFATSCAEAAQPRFDRAVALLHSFEFGAAIKAFEDTLAGDPTCAMAEWGIAVSRWGNPFAVGVRPAAQLQQGRAAVERARSIGAKSERELVERQQMNVEQR